MKCINNCLEKPNKVFEETNSRISVSRLYNLRLTHSN